MTTPFSLKGVTIKTFTSSSKIGSSGEIEQVVRITLEARVSDRDLANLARYQREQHACVVSFEPHQLKLPTKEETND